MAKRVTLALSCNTPEAEAVVKLWLSEFCNWYSHEPFMRSDISNPNKFWLKMMVNYKRIRNLMAQGYTAFSAASHTFGGTRDVSIIGIEDLDTQPQRFCEVVRAAPGGIELTLEFDQIMFDHMSQWMGAMGIRDIVQFMDLALANALVIHRFSGAGYQIIRAHRPSGEAQQVQLIGPKDFGLQPQRVRVGRTFEGDLNGVIWPPGTELED